MSPFILFRAEAIWSPEKGLLATSGSSLPAAVSSASVALAQPPPTSWEDQR